MEGDEQRRRQYDRPTYQRSYYQGYGTHGAHSSDPQHLRPMQAGENLDRVVQGQMLTTRAVTSTPLAAGAGISQDAGSFNFSQGQSHQTIQASPFQYQSEYVQDSQRQRFPQYPPHMTYNLPPQTQTQAQPPFDPVQPFQTNRTGAMDVLSSQFGAQSQYFSTSDASNQPPPPAIPPDYQSMPYQQTMHYDTQGALGRSTLASSYPTMTSDVVQASSIEIAVGAGMETDIAAENNGRYYHAIGETNHSTHRGMLVQAGNSLMQITDWLLPNAVRLGLLLITIHLLRSPNIRQASPPTTLLCMHSDLRSGTISTIAGLPYCSGNLMRLNE